jgi:hypothetical protein
VDYYSFPRKPLVFDESQKMPQHDEHVRPNALDDDMHTEEEEVEEHPCQKGMRTIPEAACKLYVYESHQLWIISIP